MMRNFQGSSGAGSVTIAYASREASQCVSRLTLCLTVLQGWRMHLEENMQKENGP